MSGLFSQPHQDVVHQRDGQRDEHAKDDSATTKQARQRRQVRQNPEARQSGDPRISALLLAAARRNTKLRAERAGRCLRRAEDVRVHAVLLGEDEGDNALRQRGLRCVVSKQNKRQSEAAR